MRESQGRQPQARQPQGRQPQGLQPQGRRPQSPRVVLACLLMFSLQLIVSGCGSTTTTTGYEARGLYNKTPVSTAAFIGRPVVLVSWATWCRECEKELKRLGEFSTSKEAEGVVIVAVNLDIDAPRSEIDKKLKGSGLEKAELWSDPKNGFKRFFGAIGVPTTVVLARDGTAVGSFAGAVDFEQSELQEALTSAKKSK